jgi:hypothetical protein
MDMIPASSRRIGCHPPAAPGEGRRARDVRGDRLPDGSCATSSLTSPARLRCARVPSKRSTQNATPRACPAPAGYAAFSGALGRSSGHGTHRRRGEGHFRSGAPGMSQVIMGYWARDIGGTARASDGPFMRRGERRTSRAPAGAAASAVAWIRGRAQLNKV